MTAELCFYNPQGTQPEALKHLNLITATEVPKGLALVYDDQRLGLKDFTQPKTGAVVVDFSTDAMQYRAKQGSIKNESIAKAVGIKGGQPISVVDATAGLGRDAFMLMSLGASVTLLERSPIVAALLADGIDRAQRDGLLSDGGKYFSLLPGQASKLLNHWKDDPPDVIYLDPMFPHKKKSALVKKEMRLFQRLLGADNDADELLAPALTLARKRVVVKRPDYAPFLCEQKPSMQIKSKKHRFDVYLTHNE